jgi:hypothetical protein
MNSWIPTVVTIVGSILASIHAPDWIAAHPQLAAGLAGLYALIKGLLPSPIQ